MSKETWLAEFYPKPVSETSVEEAVDHCLNKWRGFRKSELLRHSVASPPVGRSGDSCALCFHHLDRTHTTATGSCDTCPIVIVTGVTCEDTEPTSDERVGPWWDYTRDNNPEPMIVVLELVKKEYNAKSQVQHGGLRLQAYYMDN